MGSRLTPQFSGGALNSAERRERKMKWRARVATVMASDRPLQLLVRRLAQRSYAPGSNKREAVNSIAHALKRIQSEHASARPQAHAAVPADHGRCGSGLKNASKGIAAAK
jgi:hypothetical protein